MPFLNETQKKEMNAANLAAFDTVLQRNMTLTEKLASLSLKSALLVSKVYLTDVQFVDHKATWKFCRDPWFKQLLSEDFDGKPAISVGLRKGCSTPIDTLNQLIRNKALFSSLLDKPDIQEQINNEKIGSADELFKKIDPSEKIYPDLKATSNLWIDKIPRWETELKHGQYYDLIKGMTNAYTEKAEGVMDLKKIAVDFSKEMDKRERTEYTRSQAYYDLFKVTSKENISSSPFQLKTNPLNFQKIVIDSGYNINLSLSNTGSIIWHQSQNINQQLAPSLQEINKQIPALNNEYLVNVEAEELAKILEIMPFKFIYELRTWNEYKEMFRKGINDILTAPQESKQEKISDHMRFIFDKFAERSEYKDKLSELFPDSQRKAWFSVNHPQIPTVTEHALAFGHIFLEVALLASYPLPYPIIVASIALTGTFEGRRLLGSIPNPLQDRFKYTREVRLAKTNFTKDLIKAVTEQ